MADTAKPKVLVVEDDSEIANLLAASLDSCGFAVKIIADGGMALSAVRSEKFDYIVLDIHLPSMNGIQLAAVIKSSETNSKTPITITTGSLDDDKLKRIGQLKIANLVEKPYDFGAMAESIKVTLDQQKKKSSPPSYDTKIINAFVTSAQKVFSHYGLDELEIKKPLLRNPKGPSTGIITALMSFQGNGYVGSIGLVVNGAFVKTMANQLFPESTIELNREVAADIVGEICNQILGGVKLRFNDLGIRMTIGLPEMVVGKGHIVIHKVVNPVLCLPIRIGPVAACILEFVMDQRQIEMKEEEKVEQLEAGAALLF